MKLNLCALNCVTWKLGQRFLRWQSRRSAAHQVWNSVHLLQCFSDTWKNYSGSSEIYYLFIFIMLMCDTLYAVYAYKYIYYNVHDLFVCERGLLWVRHMPLPSLALPFGTNSLLRHDPLY